MSTKKSFELFDGLFLSQSSLVSQCLRAATDQLRGREDMILHIHVAGPSGRGKSHFANKLAKMLITAEESADYVSSVKVLSLDRYGQQKDGKWVVNKESLLSALSLNLKNANFPVRFLITEGTSDNDDEVIAAISTLEMVSETVCCVVEPKVQSWIRMNQQKAKDAKNVPDSWTKHWSSIGGLTFSEAADLMYIDTANSYDYWNKYTYSVCVAMNYFIATPKVGWFQPDDVSFYIQ